MDAGAAPERERGRGADRLGHDQRSLALPPQRDLVPPHATAPARPRTACRGRLSGGAAAARRASSGDRLAVTVVAVEQLEHAGGGAERLGLAQRRASSNGSTSHTRSSLRSACAVRTINPGSVQVSPIAWRCSVALTGTATRIRRSRTPSGTGCASPVCSSYVWRQTQPASLASRWIDTDVSAEVVRTRCTSSRGGSSV